MLRQPFVLLVNPWITDFAAHDMWAKPMGLLLLASLLREGGCRVALVDCLDRLDPMAKKENGIIPGGSRGYGTGKYPKTPIPKPEAYKDIPRTYFRYGLHPDTLRLRLQAHPEPDLILVTSIMTYWYPGIRDTISVLAEVFPRSPIWLGGIYARLCTGHARTVSGAHEVFADSVESLPDRIEAATGVVLSNRSVWGTFSAYPPPALDLIAGLEYAPILASRGCPFRCPYCASELLQPGWQRRSAESIYREICLWRGKGVVDFAFYDDALLLQAETTLKPALERLCVDAGVRVRFHTPNALHIRALTPEWCELLYRSGFTTIRLGLESTRPDRQRQWGGKVETDMFPWAMKNLRNAGFVAKQIGVYLLCGLPGQTPEEVAEAIDVVGDAGASPFLAEYSPLPKTAMWRDAVAISPFDIESEPLYHNNSFFACRRPEFTYDDLEILKQRALRVRRSISGGAVPP